MDSVVDDKERYDINNIANRITEVSKRREENDDDSV